MDSSFHFSSQDEDHQIIVIDQSLEIPDVKILTNYVDKSNKTKLAIRASSWVWDHMKKDNITTLTTHLCEHLNSVHQIFFYQQYKKISDEQTIIDSDKSMQTIPLMFSKIEVHKSAKQQKLLYRLTAWIVDYCQALSIVEENCFQQFCYEMDPCFKVPGSALIKTKIRKSVLFVEDQLHNLISKTIKTFSFTTDMWTSMHHPYIGKNAKKQFLSKIFEYWNIHNKLIGGTTDNDKSIVKRIRLLEVPHIYYTAHTIQLSIKDELNLLENVLEDTKWSLLEGEDSESELEDLTESLEPLSSSQLFQLQDAMKQLARSLCWHLDFQQRKDEQSLEWKE
ncbi:3036_t:CDS:2 [Cetraspora pellucida]|uniref:3036_t:CDS:1 n=1 Tax=Cetraspora pellucida TaxID=1433469 RepID=A0ACA9KC11_9GLOM|nr:3036_t:CDS:2 [Cetraspora pellucida]